jgi:hypothetical protein
MHRKRHYKVRKNDSILTVAAERQLKKCGVDSPFEIDPDIEISKQQRDFTAV